MTFEGLALKQARKDAGYSQRELADEIGVHHSLIAQVEAGWCLLPERVARVAADILEIPESLLLPPVEESA